MTIKDWCYVAYFIVAVVLLVVNIIIAIKSKKSAKKNSTISENTLSAVDVISAVVDAVATTEIQMKAIAPNGGGVIKKNLVSTQIKDFCKDNGLTFTSTEISEMTEKVVSLLNLDKNSTKTEKASSTSIMTLGG